MVHRDIKPENILMARDADAWLPKIADFGIVATKESSTAYTRTGGTLLTMAYAAPEQWRGTPAASLDGRTDLYALGGLLYEMLTGQTPFHAENYEGWAHQHQTTPPPPPSTLRPDLANWQGLDALTFRLLAKDRNDRPANVAELLTQLDAVRLVPPEGYRETVSEDTAIDATHAFAKNNPKPLIRSGSRWVVAAVSMLLVALLVFALSRLKTSNELTDQKPTPGFIPDPDQKPSPKPDADKWEQYIVAWTDPTTGLMWTKKDNAREVNWKQATNYCRNLQLAGHSGWRLPTIDELQGIYDANANVGGYHVKGSLQLSNWFQWSSSHGNNSGQVWGLYFTDGSRSSDSIGISTNARVLCVRRSVE
jgi:serine/threonine protein kinase